jgi:regulator of sigma E protease
MTPARDVKLTVMNDQDESREVTITPEPAQNWFLPDNRGIRLEEMLETQLAPNFLAAIGMGITHTKNSASDIYLTLRNLFGGSISYKELHGPVGIAKVAYHIASNGLPELLLFLGFLSVNLAVLNFLPIPVLDGGHMVFLIWEGVTRSKPSERVLWAAQALGFLFVVGLMLLVLFLDIFVHGHVN